MSEGTAPQVDLVWVDAVREQFGKVIVGQRALLGPMQERQVTIGDQAFPLPSPFLVLATQNPIEQEGTYRLPEAQLDRFLFKIKVNYPSAHEERQIVRCSTDIKAIQQ